MSIHRLFALVLTCVLVGVGTTHAQTVKIGTATDLTGIGALIAKAGVAGMEVAVEEINGKGGLLGRKVDLPGTTGNGRSSTASTSGATS